MMVAKTGVYHPLKTWPEYYEAILTGHKKFEYRINDRKPAFAVGDTLKLQEYDPETEKYTGREIEKVVTYVLHIQFGEYVIMSIA